MILFFANWIKYERSRDFLKFLPVGISNVLAPPTGGFRESRVLIIEGIILSSVYT